MKRTLVLTPEQLEYAKRQSKPAAQDHDYLSTACYHGQHEDCRVQCKFCKAYCKCECHWQAKAKP